MLDKKPNKLKTMMFAKDMRVPNPNYLENYDKMEWDDEGRFEVIEEEPAMGRKRYRFKK